MKRIYFVTLALLLVLPFASLSAANDDAGPNGIHEPGTGIENPEIKQEGQGTGQGLANTEEVQNQIQNQGEESQVTAQNREEVRAQLAEEATQRKSVVANAVAEMLQFADRDGGIGEQIREIAQNQNQNFGDVEKNLERAQERSNFAKFFIGPNYGQIHDAEQKMERIQERVQELTQLKEQIANQADQDLIQEQIQSMEQTRTELQTQLKEEQKGFSLLGWMFRLFAR